MSVQVLKIITSHSMRNMLFWFLSQFALLLERISKSGDLFLYFLVPYLRERLGNF